MKYTTQEKMDILNEWFEKDNIIKKPLTGLPRYNSRVDEDIEKNNRLVFELLELDGPDCIRFAVGRPNDCTCRSAVADFDDIWHLYELIHNYVRDTVVKNRKELLK